jgi:hypothetical protein
MLQVHWSPCIMTVSLCLQSGYPFILSQYQESWMMPAKWCGEDCGCLDIVVLEDYLFAMSNMR